MEIKSRLKGLTAATRRGLRVFYRLASRDVMKDVDPPDSFMLRENQFGQTSNLDERHGEGNSTHTIREWPWARKNSFSYWRNLFFGIGWFIIFLYFPFSLACFGSRDGIRLNRRMWRTAYRLEDRQQPENEIKNNDVKAVKKPWFRLETRNIMIFVVVFRDMYLWELWVCWIF